jgi:lipoyl(octanoyl) transferase
VSPAPFSSQWLGRLGYEEALARQEEIVARKIAAPDEPDVLLLLEHEPVYTIGRTPDRSSLRTPEALPHPLVQISRGGQATYHGPGQLVGYPLLDLRKRGQDLHRYLRALEELLIVALATWKLDAKRREGLTGVWIEKPQDRIHRRGRAALGEPARLCAERLRRPRPFPGDSPLRHLGVEMTSIALETDGAVTVQEVATEIARLFEQEFANCCRSANPAIP